MNLGLTSSQYDFLLRHLVSPLEQRGASLWAFGSRARGDHHSFSDVDIMVESPEDLSTAISRIEEFFSSSNFPYKIDLVEFRNFAESYKEGYFQDRKKLTALGGV